MLVETSVVVSVTTFDLAIMPWCSWSNQLVFNTQFLTKQVQRMNLFGLLEMSKLKTIIRLNDVGFVAKVFHSHFEELNS